MIIYYCIAIIANIVAAIAFQKNINITGLSLISPRFARGFSLLSAYQKSLLLWEKGDRVSGG